MNSQNELLEQIEKLQQSYYEQHNKKQLFKTKQKLECASAVSSQLNLNQLINHTVYIIPNTNKVFFDYSIFKTYATPELYTAIIDKILYLFEICIEYAGGYEMHINLTSLTITAAERYKNVLTIINDKSRENNNKYSYLLTKFFIYNPPNVFDSIIRIASPFMDPVVKPKINLISKTESDERLRDLFTTN
jgi:hypothetical protein